MTVRLGTMIGAIRLAPVVEAAVWNGRCWSLAIVGALQEALSDCNEAFRLEPNDTAAFASQGFTYLKTGQWDSAIQDYSSALQHQLRFASSLYGRGLAKREKGDTAAAGKADMAETSN